MICRLPTNFMPWQEKFALFNEGQSPPGKNSLRVRYCDKTIFCTLTTYSPSPSYQSHPSTNALLLRRLFGQCRWLATGRRR